MMLVTQVGDAFNYAITCLNPSLSPTVTNPFSILFERIYIYKEREEGPDRLVPVGDSGQVHCTTMEYRHQRVFLGACRVRAGLVQP